MRVVGARPQFMQVKFLRGELELRGHKEVLLHTGQHYDDNMSRQFFEDLGLPQADINLHVGSGLHADQTGKMMTGIERELLDNPYDALVVDGDTNSTLAGALAATKQHVPVIHIEAGMRSFNRIMPEEINRVVTDHVSSLLFCPSDISFENLKAEGIVNNVSITGDLLTECFYHFKPRALDRVDTVLGKLGLEKDKYVLLTMHRAETLKTEGWLHNYLQMIKTSEYPVVWPLHPHTRKIIEQQGQLGLVESSPFVTIEPVGYLDMLALQSGANYILTDSGGVQREAFHWRKPCTVLRESTEWLEIVRAGYARLVPGNAVQNIWFRDIPSNPEWFPYGKDQVSKHIVDYIEAYFA